METGRVKMARRGVVVRKLKSARRVLALWILLNSWSVNYQAESATPAARSVPLNLRIAYVAPIGVMAPVWVAAESGAFKAEGLEVELIYIEARSAIAALVAKEVDALEISAPGMIPASLAGGEITMIAGLLNKMIYSFHAQKEIKSAEQLRGKVVGTDRLGTPSDYGTRVALENDPEMLQKTYEFFTGQAGFNKDMGLTDQGLQQILTFLGSTTLPTAKDAPPTRFYDTRILNSIGK
jgi:hypothetical protein